MDYSGMTVNERLFEAKLLDAFQEAIRKKDRLLMIELLKKTQLNQKQAEETTDRLLENPEFYGY